MSSAPPTVLAAEVGQGHVLQGDLLQEARPLAARVPRHDLPAPQPIAQPGQPAVAVEGVGQQVAARRGGRRDVIGEVLKAVAGSQACGRGSHRVERVCSVSKAPGAMVVSWLS